MQKITLAEQWIISAHFLVDSLELPRKGWKQGELARTCEGARMFVRYAEPDAYTLGALLSRIDFVEARQ